MRITGFLYILSGDPEFFTSELIMLQLKTAHLAVEVAIFWLIALYCTTFPIWALTELMGTHYEVEGWLRNCVLNT